MNCSGKVVLVALALRFTLLGRGAIAQDPSTLPYMNPKLSSEERAKDLVRRMSLEERHRNW